MIYASVTWWRLQLGLKAIGLSGEDYLEHVSALITFSLEGESCTLPVQPHSFLWGSWWGHTLTNPLFVLMIRSFWRSRVLAVWLQARTQSGRDPPTMVRVHMCRQLCLRGMSFEDIFTAVSWLCSVLSLGPVFWTCPAPFFQALYSLARHRTWWKVMAGVVVMLQLNPPPWAMYTGAKCTMNRDLGCEVCRASVLLFYDPCTVWPRFYPPLGEFIGLNQLPISPLTVPLVKRCRWAAVTNLWSVRISGPVWWFVVPGRTFIGLRLLYP